MTQPLTLFIIPGACSFGSGALLEWINLPYNIVITNTQMRASESFLKINPLGKVGALQDGEFLVTESLAILYYLANKYDKFANKSLDLEQKTTIFRWLEFSSTSLHAAFSPCFSPERFVTSDIAAKYKITAMERLNKALTHVNEYLSDKDYFVANQLTIADLQLYGILRWVERVFDENHQYDNIRKFREKLQQEQIVKNTLAIEKNELEKVQNSNFAGYYKFS